MAAVYLSGHKSRPFIHSLCDSANVKGTTIATESVHALEQRTAILNSLEPTLCDELVARLGEECHRVLDIVPVFVEHRLQQLHFVRVRFLVQFDGESRSEIDGRTNLLPSDVRREDSDGWVRRADVKDTELFVI